MQNQSDERISSLIDGELDDQERHEAVAELLANEQSRRSWARYHLVGDTLKRNLPDSIDSQFSARVMDALKDEPTILAPPPQAASSMGRRLTGLAIAASVAAVAVLGVQFMYQQDGMAPTQQFAQAPVARAPLAMAPERNIARVDVRPNVQTVTQTSRPANASLAAAQEFKRFHPNLNQYLVDHNQLAPRLVVQGVLPYARIVAVPNKPPHSLAQVQKQQ
jgi:negative regulator of sigma E activity